MPVSSPNLPADYTGKLFGIMYITLLGVIDTIIPAAGPWGDSAHVDAKNVDSGHINTFNVDTIVK
ncbi:hypothetical protein DSO57_1024316 [Entomophthora muscae]|uniref:Uncharacterized protein n=1 Tax=Entomophthora muscae TaxID=34485 RepID=A0ACC2U154_9FUNG|nr:hypothetical protein DSO57_1024316 [Entomophthora muscae]